MNKSICIFYKQTILRSEVLLLSEPQPYILTIGRQGRKIKQKGYLSDLNDLTISRPITRSITRERNIVCAVSRRRKVGFIFLVISQIVVLIGSSASANDISRDIAKVAKEVHIASRSVQIEELGKLSGHENICLHSMISYVCKDGTVAFEDGKEVCADVILHCTGYKYDFPFLETDGIVTVDDNRVGPLYKHIFPPALASWLSFVGLPWKVVPFPMFEYQCKWIAGVLSGQIPLPTINEMMADVEGFYSSMEASGIAKRFTHKVGDLQFEYNDWLAGLVLLQPKNGEIRCIWWLAGKREMHLADRDFEKYISNVENSL